MKISDKMIISIDNEMKISAISCQIEINYLVKIKISTFFN